MDDRRDKIIAIVFALSGLKAEGFLLEMLCMDLEAARVAASFLASSALALLLARMGLGYIRSGIAILRRLGARRNQQEEDQTTTGGNEHEAEAEEED